MRDLIINLFGEYQPLIDTEGNYITTIAGLDWSYIGGIVLFGIVLLSLFKLLGVVLKD